MKPQEVDRLGMLICNGPASFNGNGAVWEAAEPFMNLFIWLISKKFTVELSHLCHVNFETEAFVHTKDVCACRY